MIPQKGSKWFEAAKTFLASGDFPNGYCHMKFRAAGEKGMPKKFGIVSYLDVTLIQLLDEKGNLSKETEKFNSIDEMLSAGWDVD